MKILNIQAAINLLVVVVSKILFVLKEPKLLFCAFYSFDAQKVSRCS